MARNLKEHNFFGFDATMVADSLNHVNGDRLTTMVVTLPRIVLAEFNTHRVFSRNSASSRAIPYRKMVERVKSSPYIPLAFQKDHTGMQGTEYITDPMEIQSVIGTHLKGRDWALVIADEMSKKGVTKQIVNRYLEPFLWHTIIVTSTEWENFFELRSPQFQIPVDGNETKYKSRKDLLNSVKGWWVNGMKEPELLDWLKINKSQADIHIQFAAEVLWDTYNSSTPKVLLPGEWHLPFATEINDLKLEDILESYPFAKGEHRSEVKEALIRKIAVVMAARLSYGNIDVFNSDYVADLKLYDRLHSSKHASPFEHIAQSMTTYQYYRHVKGEAVEVVDEHGLFFHSDHYGWCRNFQGFIQERVNVEL